MNIDITNYLSTIKHISNGSQFSKNATPFPKQLENMQNNATAKTGKTDIDKNIGNRNGIKNENLDDFTKNHKIEPKHDIFIDESSELEEEMPDAVKELEYSPIRPEAKLEAKGEPDDREGVFL